MSANCGTIRRKKVIHWGNKPKLIQVNKIRVGKGDYVNKFIASIKVKFVCIATKDIHSFLFPVQPQCLYLVKH